MKRFFIIATLGFLSISLQAFAQEIDRASFDDPKLEYARQEYWNNIRTSGDEKDLQKIERRGFEAMRSMENHSMFKPLASVAWQPIGGSIQGHSSGRIRGLAVDPTNQNVVYIAAASGGIWKTNDISAKPVQWINLSDRLPTVLFGALAIDPQHPNVIYAGTGESQGDNNRNTNYQTGTGIFKSDDGGLNWTNIANNTVAGGYCSQILIDSINTSTIYVATGSSIGILKSTDAGASWIKHSVGGLAPLAIAYSSQEPYKLYASGFGSIYRSVDSGVNWIKCTTGLTAPPGTSFGRINIACAPTAPNLIYASIGNNSNRKTLGVWLSNDYGLTWKKMMQYNPANAASPTNYDVVGYQQEWCNAITIRPNNPKQIFVGGLDVYSSPDSGKSFQPLSSWSAPIGNYPPSYVHADIHHLAFIGNVLYAITDGGIARTMAPFQQWNTELNEGLSTLQFVGADGDKNFTFVTGGCQDNGTNRAYVGSTQFTPTHGGDGGRGWVAPDDGSIVYTTYVYSTFFKSLDSGKTYGSNLILTNPALYYEPTSNTGTGEGAPFYPSYDVSSDGTIVAFGGNSHIWVSANGGDDGFATKSDKMISNSLGVHVSQFDPAYMWAGTSTVYSSTNQGTNWTTTSLTAPAGFVTAITSDPTNKDKVFVATAGVGATKKHFFLSTDGGKTFTSPATNFPDVPCWSIAFNPTDNKIFVGTDKGVVYSEDGGVTWNPVMNGMPFVQVMSLKIKGSQNNILLAGTYGRGIFSLDITTLDVKQSLTGKSSLQLDPIQPNPVTGSEARMNFTLPTPGVVQTTLYDMLGREVRILDKNFYDAGSHSVSFSASGLTKGTYVVGLISNGKAVSQKVIIE